MLFSELIVQLVTVKEDRQRKDISHHNKTYTELTIINNTHNVRLLFPDQIDMK